MAKSKRGLQLGAGITGVCMSSILTVFWLIGFIQICSFAQYVGAMIVVYLVFLGLEIARIVVFALILPKPTENKTHRGVVVASIVLTSIFFIFFFIATIKTGDPLAIVLLVLNIVVLALLICALAVGNSKPESSSKIQVPNINQVQSYTYTQPTQQVPTYVQPAPQVKQNIDKIDRIKQLHEEGIISTEDMKALILEELKKSN